MPGDNFRKVHQGQKLEIAASTWNKLLDVAQGVGGQRGGAGQLREGREGVIRFHNDSGNNLPQFAVMEFRRPTIDPSDFEAAFLQEPAYSGDIASANSKAVVVLQEPAIDNTIVKAVSSGLTHVRLNVPNTDTYTIARPSDGDSFDAVANLSEGDLGVPIVWHEDGPGTVWATVILPGFIQGFGGISGSNLSPCGCGRTIDRDLCQIDFGGFFPATTNYKTTGLLGQDILLEYTGGTGVWETDSFSLTCGPSDGRTVFYRLTATSNEPGGLVLELTDGSTALATWTNQVFWKPWNGVAMYLVDIAVDCPDYEPACAMCVSPSIVGGCPCNSISYAWSVEIPAIHFSGASGPCTGVEFDIPAGTVLLPYQGVVSGTNCRWSTTIGDLVYNFTTTYAGSANGSNNPGIIDMSVINTALGLGTCGVAWRISAPGHPYCYQSPWTLDGLSSTPSFGTSAIASIVNATT